MKCKTCNKKMPGDWWYDECHECIAKKPKETAKCEFCGKEEDYDILSEEVEDMLVCSDCLEEQLKKGRIVGNHYTLE